MPGIPMAESKKATIIKKKETFTFVSLLD